MKARDLQPSHDYREIVAKYGTPDEHRRRIHVAPPLSSINRDGKEVTLTSKSEKNDGFCGGRERPGTYSNVDKEMDEVRPVRDELRDWVKERRSLRKDLESLRLSKTLLQNKPNKTICESRVLQRLETRDRQRNLTHLNIPTVTSAPKISAAHIAVLPHLSSPLPIALAIIADYLQEHRMRLVDLFSRADRDKDWLTTRDELRYALKEGGVPLSDAQIDELVMTLDLNNDDQLSYKELAMGIDAYRKDKRWKKLKEIFDVLVEKGDGEEQELTDSYNDRKVAMDLLRLPKFDGAKQNMELMDHLSAREKRNRQIVEKRKRKIKVKNGVKSEYITTLSGNIGDSKIRYLQFIDKECKRCIEELHINNLPTTSEDVTRILIPPTENPRAVCQGNLYCEQSMFPNNHPTNQRNRENKSNTSNHQPTPFDNSNGTKTSTTGPIQPTLPRVATIDFKNRAMEGRKRLEEFRQTSPSPQWPQHLLDKLRLYMENDAMTDKKGVLFNEIRRT